MADDVRGAGAAVTVAISGDIDTFTAESVSAQLADALSLALARQAPALIIDLRKVDYFGSAGLTIVIECHERAVCAGIAVRVVATQVEVTRPLQVIKLDRVLSVYSTVAKACAGD